MEGVVKMWAIVQDGSKLLWGPAEWNQFDFQGILNQAGIQAYLPKEEPVDKAAALFFDTCSIVPVGPRPDCPSDKAVALESATVDKGVVSWAMTYRDKTDADLPRDQQIAKIQSAITDAKDLDTLKDLMVRLATLIR